MKETAWVLFLFKKGLIQLTEKIVFGNHRFQRTDEIVSAEV